MGKMSLLHHYAIISASMTSNNREGLNLTKAESRFSKTDPYSKSHSDEYTSQIGGPDFTVELRKPRAYDDSIRDLVVRINSPEQRGKFQGLAYLDFALIVDRESNVTGVQEDSGDPTSLFYYPPEAQGEYYVAHYFTDPDDPTGMKLNSILKMKFEENGPVRDA